MPYPHNLHIADRCLPDGINPRQGGRQVIEIILLYKELRHDIERDVHIVEKSRKLETPVLDGSEDYMLRREIDTALNEAVARMQAYVLLPSAFARRISTDHAGEWEEKNVFLGLPHNWPPYLVDTLRDAVHNYIVHSVVFYLMTLSLPGDPFTSIVNEQKQRAYNDINSYINARLDKMKIHPTFIG